jgi:hypothetical protein
MVKKFDCHSSSGTETEKEEQTGEEGVRERARLCCSEKRSEGSAAFMARALLVVQETI